MPFLSPNQQRQSTEGTTILTLKKISPRQVDRIVIQQNSLTVEVVDHTYDDRRAEYM